MHYVHLFSVEPVDGYILHIRFGLFFKTWFDHCCSRLNTTHTHTHLHKHIDRYSRCFYSFRSVLCRCLSVWFQRKFNWLWKRFEQVQICLTIRFWLLRLFSQSKRSVYYRYSVLDASLCAFLSIDFSLVMEAIQVLIKHLFYWYGNVTLGYFRFMFEFTWERTLYFM